MWTDDVFLREQADSFIISSKSSIYWMSLCANCCFDVNYSVQCKCL